MSPLESVARRVRGKVLELSHRAQTAHLAGALSVVDILVALYWGVLRVDPGNPRDPGRDRLIFSKGHTITALYACLALRRFFPEAWLETFNQNGSRLPEHPAPDCVPGLELATGSLGHGLPVGVGMALAGRILRRDYRVYVVLSDGECEEGSVWEAAMFAPIQRLDNLVAIVDYNKWQATGRSPEIMALDPLAAKWAAFGWNAVEVDGHDLLALVRALRQAPANGKPTAIVAHTVKGKGVSFIENDNNWHYRAPTAAELDAARRELELA